MLKNLSKWETNRKKIEVYNEKVEKELDKHVKEVKKKMRNDSLVPRDFPKKDLDKWERIYKKETMTLPTLFQLKM